jgi:hypothetical protein
LYRDISDKQYRQAIDCGALSDEEITILKRMRRGDPVGLIGIDMYIPERTLSRRLAYIRKVINDLV